MANLDTLKSFQEAIKKIDYLFEKEMERQEENGYTLSDIHGALEDMSDSFEASAKAVEKVSVDLSAGEGDTCYAVHLDVRNQKGLLGLKRGKIVSFTLSHVDKEAAAFVSTMGNKYAIDLTSTTRKGALEKAKAYYETLFSDIMKTITNLGE